MSVLDTEFQRLIKIYRIFNIEPIYMGSADPSEMSRSLWDIRSTD